MDKMKMFWSPVDVIPKTLTSLNFNTQFHTQTAQPQTSETSTQSARAAALRRMPSPRRHHKRLQVAAGRKRGRSRLFVLKCSQVKSSCRLMFRVFGGCCGVADVFVSQSLVFWLVFGV